MDSPGDDEAIGSGGESPGTKNEIQSRRNNNRKERARIKFFKFFTRFSDPVHIEMIGCSTVGKDQSLRKFIEEVVSIHDIRQICLLQKHINFSLETNKSDLKILNLQSHMLHVLLNCF